MLQHFNKLQTPIQAVADYPSLSKQKGRFTTAGWSHCSIRNLWDLWSDDDFTPESLRRSLDAVEPFDEWEEFALFAGHYFLLVASNTEAYYLEDGYEGEVTSQPADADADADARMHDTLSKQSLALTHTSGTPAPLTLRRFGAGFALDNETVAIHGGQGVQTRLGSIDVLSSSTESSPTIHPLLHSAARICHTITPFSPTTALLTGGRTSPAHALASCYRLSSGIWTPGSDLPSGRYRHVAVRVNIPRDWSRPGSGSETPAVCPVSNDSGVLIFGGKTSTGAVLDEVLLWTANQGWVEIPVVGSGMRPSARFGAAICAVGPNCNTGTILGGMDGSGNVLNDCWEYKLEFGKEREKKVQIQFQKLEVEYGSEQVRSAYARFGASLVPFGDRLLLVGGIASKEILGLAEEFVVLTPTPGKKVRVEVPRIDVPKGVWPLLVGTGVAAVSEREVMLVGGGAVCFSMGSFWNEGFLTITSRNAAQEVKTQPWSISTIEAVADPKDANAYADVTKSSQKPKSKLKAKSKPKHAKNHGQPKQKTTTVPRIMISSTSDFQNLLTAAKPAIITNLDLGPCTHLWTPSYLKEKLGADRPIVIHSSTASAMTFASKNFTYDRSSIGAFLDGIAAGSRTYLRAVSSTQPNKLPTKLEEDFAEIAPDFKVPDILWDEIKDHYHSSPLRISGPVSLWLHYDVLSNVLCQIQGSKTLTLFPPSDVAHLSYPPGGSSSTLPLSSLNQNPHLHPHEAFLKPGDILYIPPMWSHAATPEEGYSVAVNVFWRNLEEEEGKNIYAAGRDVYGNRDLAGYENGRRDVERIVRAFKDVPEDIRGFYVERLAMEMKEKARLK